MQPDPTPAELQWRISWLAGAAVPPPPEPPRRSKRSLGALLLAERAARRHVEELRQQTEREIVRQFGTPPAQIGRYSASIPSDHAELERQIETTSFRFVAGPESCTCHEYEARAPG